MKSNKQLAIPGISDKQLEASYTFFLDNDQGARVMRDTLASCGLRIEVLKDWFSPEEKDHIWIPQCAKKGWVIISSDKRLETLPINREALIESKAKVILLDENNSRALLWAAALIVSKSRLLRVVHQNDGPLVVNVRRQTDGLVYGVRIVTKAEPAKPRRSRERKQKAS